MSLITTFTQINIKQSSSKSSYRYSLVIFAGIALKLEKKLKIKSMSTLAITPISNDRQQETVLNNKFKPSFLVIAKKTRFGLTIQGKR